MRLFWEDVSRILPIALIILRTWILPGFPCKVLQGTKRLFDSIHTMIGFGQIPRNSDVKVLGEKGREARVQASY